MAPKAAEKKPAGKAPAKAAKPAEGEKKKGGRKKGRKETYSSYIYKVRPPHAAHAAGGRRA